MPVRQEAAELIKAGHSPIEVAKMMGKRVQDLVHLLLWQVGEGELRLSDIYLSIPESRRRQYEEAIKGWAGEDQSALLRRCNELGLDGGEFRLYAFCREALHNDMYGYLRNIEVFLHEMTRRVLEAAYPSQDDAWWYKGVPEEIRVACVETRERDFQHLEPYAYTTLIHIKRILDANWAAFLREVVLPKETSGDKRAFLSKFTRLNDIRNGVMHPIKPIEIKEDDFRFIREFSLAFVLGPETTNYDVAKWMVKEFRENERLDQRETAQKLSDTFGQKFVFTNPNGNLGIREGVLAHFRRMTRDEAVWVQSGFFWRRRKPTDPPRSRSVEF